MAYVEYSRQGWFSRIGNAFVGIIFGFILVLIAFIMLFWNEGRSVKTERRLDVGAKAVVAADSASVDPAKDGKLVHFTGQAINATGDKLTDPKFAISADAIHLQRVVEMYQWSEESKTETQKESVGGGETKRTTYTYSKQWNDKPIRSADFKEEGHKNPSGDWRFSGEKWDAAKVTVGAYQLDPNLVGDIDNFTPVSVTTETVSALPEDLQRDAISSDNAVYLRNEPGEKADPKSPEVGDLRIKFKVALPGPVSVIAQQSKQAVTAFQTPSGALEILHVGTQSAEQMFKEEQDKNGLITWLLRAVGVVMFWIGLALILNPLKVLADVIGFVGDIAGIGIFVVSGVGAVILSSVTIAAAWIAYRPLVGIGLLAVAVGAVAVFFVLRSRSAATRTAAVRPA